MILRSVIALLIAVLAGGAPVHAAQKPGDRLALTRVQDLHYGDVLFHTFLEDDFEALTRLEAYSQWGLMPHHPGEADLLAGGLYLQLGMHNEAGRRFETLLGDGIPASVRGRAWFHLARVWYARGYFDRSVASLQRIGAPLAPVMEAEKLHLWANALMHLGRYDEAILLLRDWKTTSSWASFARFNLGVALLRSNRLAEGAPFLDSGTSRTTNAELSRADKANLALGFAISEQAARESKPYLKGSPRGPQASLALRVSGANAELASTMTTHALSRTA